MARQTKKVYLFKTDNTLRVYEDSADLQADIDICREVAGIAPVAEITEVQMVMSSAKTCATAPSEEPEARKVMYTEAFEKFWENCTPKRRKEATYQAYLQAVDQAGSIGVQFDTAWAQWIASAVGTDGKPLLSLLIRFKEEFANGFQPPAVTG